MSSVGGKQEGKTLSKCPPQDFTPISNAAVSRSQALLPFAFHSVLFYDPAAKTTGTRTVNLLPFPTSL
jgi:hypothetical protein